MGGMAQDHIEGDIGRGPIAYFRARRQGRIAYGKPGGWVRWKADRGLMRLRRALRTDEERRARRELFELRRFVISHVARTEEGTALLESYEPRHPLDPDDSPALRVLG